jgi:hypothetical protein
LAIIIPRLEVREMTDFKGLVGSGTKGGSCNCTALQFLSWSHAMLLSEGTFLLWVDRIHITTPFPWSRYSH